MRVVVLRPGLPYAAAGTFASFFLAGAARGKFQHVGTGENFFPCEHLDDLALAYALAVEKPPAGQVIAVVDDDPPRLKELGRTLLDHLGGGRLSAAPVWLAGLLAGRPLAEMLADSYRVRNDRAKALLGWRPRFATLREGLPAVVEEYRRKRGA